VILFVYDFDINQGKNINKIYTHAFKIVYYNTACEDSTCFVNVNMSIGLMIITIMSVNLLLNDFIHKIDNG